MKKLINYLIEQKLLINLIVFSLLAAGFFSITHLNRESIPDIKFDMVTISTVYPGASPNEAEDLISIPIEKKLRSVSDIDKVRSYNVENVSLIVVFIEDQAKDKKKTVQDIKDAVEQVSGLPAVAQKPVVAEVSFDNTELISVAFTGKDGKDVPYSKLREFAKESEDFFYDIDGIAEVEKFGYYDREYLVEIDPDVMDKYRIGLNTLANAIKMRNIDYPGGPLRIGKKEFVLRTKGQFKNADEIRNTVIRGNDTGYALRVGDVAKVTDTYAEADVHHRFNGKQAVVFKLWKKRSADEIELAARVKKAAQSYSIPGYEDVHISFFNDSSETTQSRLSSVIHEAVVGFVILGLFMLMLLGRRMTAIVLLGIPVTYMTEFILMKYNGMTFNIMSLFGIIMVMGMVVDFSIVVSENSHRYLEHGLRKKDATIKGVSEVFGSVTVTLICIIIAFLPLLLVTGMIGKFVRPIPIIIISAMISGWIVAMFILPAYLNIFLKEEHDSGKGNIILSLINRIGSAFSRNKSYHVDSIREEDDNFEKGLFGRIQRKYKGFLTTALKHQYITAGLMLVLLVISLSLIPRLGFKFMTTGGEDKIRISVKMPFETNLETNLTEMKKIESKILSTLPQNEFKSLHVYVGEEYTSLIDPKPGKATFKSTFDIYLVKEKDRHRICDEIRDDMRNRVTEMQKAKIISGDMDIKFESVMLGPPVGKPVNVEIRGKDFATISKIADEYMGYLKSVNGVYDISIDLEGGKTEYHYTVNERMAALTGVSAYDIAEALNASFSGAVATKVNQNEEEVPVRVRFEETAREQMRGRSDVKIANYRGGLIPINGVSDVKIDKSYSQINRLNYERLVQVQAEVNVSKTTPVAVTKLLESKFHDIEKRYPGYDITYGGEQEDTNESMSELGMLFEVALLVILFVLIIYFKSLVIPFVVMIAIPFALVGVVFALLIHGKPLSFMSTLGLFSLAGIIVSNTLVLVKFINDFRDGGMPIKEAIIEGGVVRLRPIILTAGAMILELLPVVYGVGGKDYLVSPLALAFAYGLLFATFITLILVPCFYNIAEDLKGRVSVLLARIGINMSPEIYRPRVPAQETGLIESVKAGKKTVKGKK